MNNTLTREDILSRGFKEYKPSEFDPSSCDECYQKLYKDENGKKYFMNIKHYTLIHPTTREDIGGYELECQLYIKDTHDSFNIKFLEDDIDEAENLIEFLFDSGKLDYYERY